MKIQFKDSSVIIRRRVYNSFNYLFIGRFSTEDTKTVISGCFTVKKGPIIFINGIFIFFIIFLGVKLISFRYTQITIEDIFDVFLLIALTLFSKLFPIPLKKLGIKDKEYIVDKLKSLLNAIESDK